MDNLSLGLDVGIASLGWSLLDLSKKELVDFGVHMFNQCYTGSRVTSKSKLLGVI